MNWSTIQRTISKLRNYMRTRDMNTPVTIHPDLDHLLMGNDGSLSGLTDEQRRTMLAHWVASGANLLLGSDMIKLDSLGTSLLTDSLVWTMPTLRPHILSVPLGSSHTIKPTAIQENKFKPGLLDPIRPVRLYTWLSTTARAATMLCTTNSSKVLWSSMLQVRFSVLMG